MYISPNAKLAHKPAHDYSTFGRGAHLGIGQVVNEGEDGCRVGQLLLWPAR